MEQAREPEQALVHGAGVLQRKGNLVGLPPERAQDVRNPPGEVVLIAARFQREVEIFRKAPQMVQQPQGGAAHESDGGHGARVRQAFQNSYLQVFLQQVSGVPVVVVDFRLLNNLQQLSLHADGSDWLRVCALSARRRAARSHFGRPDFSARAINWAGFKRCQFSRMPSIQRGASAPGVR